MRIQNNITAMNTHRMYTANNNAISKSAEKLSSGYRINRAGDDAAGLAISEKMRSQIRGLNMASKNSQDANSLIQTAEGALQEVHSMLQRMNELANQSATGTNENFDRTQISAEFDQLKEEIDDISEQTNFNNMKLLNGQLGAPKAEYNAGDMKVNSTSVSGFVITGQNSMSDKVGVYTISLTSNGAAVGPTEINVEFKDSSTGNVTNTKIDLVEAVGGSTTNVAAGKAFKLDLGEAGMGTFEMTSSTGADVAALRTSLTGKTLTTTAGTGTGGAIKIQVGANKGEQLEISIKKMDAEGLGIKTASIAEQTKAGDAIDLTQKAINAVSEQRSTLGAMQNRLEHKISNLDNTSENLSASESRIRDVDIAKEMTAFTKNQILSQAATAMLAQANSLPQNVLSLMQ